MRLQRQSGTMKQTHVILNQGRGDRSWDLKGKGNHFTGIWKNKCLVNKCSLGHTATAGHRMELPQTFCWIPVCHTQFILECSYPWWYLTFSSGSYLEIRFMQFWEKKRISLSLFGLDCFQLWLKTVLKGHIPCSWPRKDPLKENLCL